MPGKRKVEEPPRLRVSKEEAEQVLGEQIRKGEAIRDGSIPDEATLKQASDGYREWRNYTSEWLRCRAFSTAELSIKFLGVHVSSTARLSFDTRVEDFRKRVRENLHELECIRQSLDLYTDAP